MKSDHPNVLLCPDTEEFPIESKEAEIHTKKLKFVHNTCVVLQFFIIITYFQKDERKNGGFHDIIIHD